MSDDTPMFEPPELDPDMREGRYSFEQTFHDDLVEAAKRREARKRDEMQRWGLVVILALSTGMALGVIAAEPHVTFAHWLVMACIAFAFLWSFNSRR